MFANRLLLSSLGWRWLPGMVLGLAGAHELLATPSIEITYAPPFGSSANLAGRVLDALPSAHRVAVFIYVPSAGWWSKPYCGSQLSTIKPDSTWTTDITTGGADEYATKITALLVSTNYSEPCVQGPATLPSNVLAHAVASVTVDRYDPAIRAIRFSDYDWWVKTSPGRVGPGPNYFSDSSSNVWVDAEGRLHLRITTRSNQWQCAEIVSRRTFGYGSYRFELDSRVDNLDLNAVLGLFTWSDDPAYTHREIDIECARWGNAADANNAQFVVQPWDAAGNLLRYAVPAGVTHSMHLFVWETNRVSCQSLRGAFSPNPNPTNVIRAWFLTNSAAVPQTGDENVRLNLWLFNGSAPVGNAEVEVVIRSFDFVPLGKPLPAVLTNFSRLPAGQCQFTIRAQPDRRCRIQFTTNLTTWETLASVLLTNASVPVPLTNAGTQSSGFFRVVQP